MSNYGECQWHLPITQGEDADEIDTFFEKKKSHFQNVNSLAKPILEFIQHQL